MKAIGIDLGGTSIKGGIVDENGRIIKKYEHETPKGVDSSEVLKRISFVINELIKDTEDISSVGIGSPGFIDIVNGKVLSIGGNIENWEGTEIVSELSKSFPNLDIYVGNDANLAGLCEGWIGASRGFESFILLTLGTGLGGCIFTKKEGLWYGKNYQSAELGHAILYPKGRKCYCGQRGCVEEYVSGTAIEELYLEKTGISKKAKEIFQVYDEDLDAREIIDDFADNLAIFISSLKNIFDPEGIVIGGGVINARKYWWDRMINTYENYVNNSKGMIILPAMHLNDAGIIGAGKLALDKTKKV